MITTKMHDHVHLKGNSTKSCCPDITHVNLSACLAQILLAKRIYAQIKTVNPELNEEKNMTTKEKTREQKIKPQPKN